MQRIIVFRVTRAPKKIATVFTIKLKITKVARIKQRPSSVGISATGVFCDAIYSVNLVAAFEKVTNEMPPDKTGTFDVIEEACQFDVEEIQLYRLKVEAYGDYQGPIKQVKEKKPAVVPTNEDAIMMKQIAIDVLREYGYTEKILRRVFTRSEQDYSHYAHNQCCTLQDEVGFGLATFSSLRDRFVLTTANFDEYYSKIESGHLPLNRGLVRDHEELVRWATILPLKNRTIRKRDFTRVTGLRFEQVFQAKIERLAEAGLLTETDRAVSLTELGRFFADEVVQQFYAQEHLPFPVEDYAAGPLHPLNDSQPLSELLPMAAE